MFKNTLIIALVIVTIYLYYQNKKSRGLATSSDNSAPAEELMATKDHAITQLKAEKSQVEITLTSQLQELQAKYSKQSKILDEEQLENNKLTEQVEQLTTEQQAQLRQIYLLFDLRAHSMPAIDFNQLVSRLKEVKKQLNQKK